MSVPAAPAEPAPARVIAPRSSGAAVEPAPPAAPARRPALWWPMLVVAGVICFITFYAKGGLNLEPMTTTEMALTLGAGALVAAIVVLTPRGRPVYGAWPLALLFALAALSALSIVWSVQPDASWQDAGRLLSYGCVFGAAIAVVRFGPERWPALLGGIVLAAVVVCGYALLTKIFPASLAAANPPARLEEPFGYWNATGITAAMGAVCCMWLGARRHGHGLLNALAYPAIGLLLLTLALAYSRGALAAFAIGIALWFGVVPLRLRGAAILALGALGAGIVAAWDFSTHALSADGIDAAARTSAGHQLGVLIAAMLVLLALAGVAIGFLTDRQAPSRSLRQAAGTALIVLIVFAVLAFVGVLAHSQRGLTGSISHAFSSLTNPNAKTPPNTPDRLTAVASVRARYWKQALEVFAAHPALGSGAEGYATAHLHYRDDTLVVRHAHGFIVQTLADLGIVGLVLALALLASWMAAAGRATHPFNRRWTGWRELLRVGRGGRPAWRAFPAPYTPERVGLLSMLCVVVVFGAHSLIDWTWYVPGDACVALLCAGWLAGRGPLAPRATEASRATEPSRGPGAAAAPRRLAFDARYAVAAAVVVGALLAAWSQWQPQRAEDARAQALALLAAHPQQAAAAARRAVDRDPLSIEALFTLAEVQSAQGHPAQARATLQRAVDLQPSNPASWLRLGRYDLHAGASPAAQKAALSELEAAIYLNPSSISPEAIAAGEREAIELHNEYISALRANAALSSASARRARAAAAARRAARRRAARRSRRSQSRRAGR
jgi:hypothetical protein